MSEPEKVQSSPEEGSPAFCATAQNGNMIGRRGGTFGTRQAIFFEQQKKEVSHHITHNGEEE